MLNNTACSAFAFRKFSADRMIVFFDAELLFKRTKWLRRLEEADEDLAPLTWMWTDHFDLHLLDFSRILDTAKQTIHHTSVIRGGLSTTAEIVEAYRRHPNPVFIFVKTSKYYDWPLASRSFVIACDGFEQAKREVGKLL